MTDQGEEGSSKTVILLYLLRPTRSLPWCFTFNSWWLNQSHM